MKNPIVPIMLLLAASACDRAADPAPAPKTTPTAVAAGQGGPSATSIATPRTRDWSRTVARTPEGGVLFGNPAAAHRLVEYGARTCPACARFGIESSEPLMRDYVARGDVSYEFRDFLVHGAPDLAAALVGHCGDVARFAANLESDFRHQDEAMARLQSIPEREVKAMADQPPSRIVTMIAERGGYVDRAAALGLPRPQALACLADDAAMKTMANRTRDADTSLVDATPTFILDGRKLPSHDWAGVRKALDAAR